MSDCELFSELISAAIDGQLSDQEKYLLDTHIAVCEECNSLFQGFTDISFALSHSLVDPPDSLLKGIMYKINLDNNTPAVKTGFLRRFSAGRFSVAAAVLIIILFLSSSWSPFNNSNSSAPLAVLYAGEPTYAVEGARPEAALASPPERRDSSAADALSSFSPVSDSSFEGSGSIESELPAEFNEDDADIYSEEYSVSVTHQYAITPNATPQPSDLLSGSTPYQDLTLIIEQYSYHDIYYAVAIIPDYHSILSSYTLKLESDSELHFLLPSDTIDELNDKSIFSDIFYDNSSADYGIVVLYK